MRRKALWTAGICAAAAALVIITSAGVEQPPGDPPRIVVPSAGSEPASALAGNVFLDGSGAWVAPAEAEPLAAPASYGECVDAATTKYESCADRYDRGLHGNNRIHYCGYLLLSETASCGHVFPGAAP